MGCISKQTKQAKTKTKAELALIDIYRRFLLNLLPLNSMV